MELAELYGAFASPGYFQSVGQRLRYIPERSPHFLRRFHPELVGVDLHPVGRAEDRLGLNAHKHLMGEVIALVQIMAVIGCNKGYAHVLGHFHKLSVYLHLLRQAVILYLKEEVVLAQNIPVGFRGADCVGQVIAVYRTGYLPREAGGKTYEPFGVLRQKFFVYPRLVVETFKLGSGGEKAEVGKPLVVFRQQDEVVVLVLAFLVALVEPRIRRDIDLAPENRLEFRRLRLLVEIHNAVHCAVICHGDRFTALFLYPFHEIGDFDRAVQK